MDFFKNHIFHFDEYYNNYTFLNSIMTIILNKFCITIDIIF